MNDAQRKTINTIRETEMYQEFTYSEGPGSVVKIGINGVEYFIKEDGTIHSPSRIICDMCKHSFEMRK